MWIQSGPFKTSPPWTLISPQRSPWPRPLCVTLPPDFWRPGTPYCGRLNTLAYTPGNHDEYCRGRKSERNLWSSSHHPLKTQSHRLTNTKILTAQMSSFLLSYEQIKDIFIFTQFVSNTLEVFYFSCWPLSIDIPTDPDTKQSEAAWTLQGSVHVAFRFGRRNFYISWFPPCTVSLRRDIT